MVDRGVGEAARDRFLRLAPTPRSLAIALLLVALIAVVSAFNPVPSAVHDDLSSSTPGDGDTLAAVADTLRLTFTRAQNLELASVRMVGPAGEVELGGLRAHPDSSAIVLVPVRGAWSAGAHTVRWRIVGQDGHPVTGEYTFDVDDDADGLPVTVPELTPLGPVDGAVGQGAADVESADGMSDSFGVRSAAYVAVRWLGFVALLGVIGSASWGLLVLPAACRRDGEVDVAGGRASAARVGAWSAGLLLVAAAARLWAQGRALGGSGSDGSSVLGAVLASTIWGAGWWLQLVGSLVALGCFLWARRGRTTLPWTFLGAASLLLAFTPALSGHAVGSGGAVSLAVLADGLHVLAAGGWMGGLLLLLVVAVPAALEADGSRSRLAPLVEGFSLTALGFSALLVGTGVFAAWLHLGSFEALWSSTYGRTLGIKLLLLVPLVGTGAYNWLRVRPSLSSGAEGAPRLRRSGAVELAVAVLVLLATAVLVATPPPAEMAGTEVAQSSSSHLQKGNP